MTIHYRDGATTTTATIDRHNIQHTASKHRRGQCLQYVVQADLRRELYRLPQSSRAGRRAGPDQRAGAVDGHREQAQKVVQAFKSEQDRRFEAYVGWPHSQS